MSTPSFRVAISASAFKPDGSPQWKNLGLETLAEAGLEYAAISEKCSSFTPQQLRDSQAVVVLAERVTTESLAKSADLLAVVRFGVGYDLVDVPACTDANVAVVITAGATDRPVAEATVGWMIAITHHTLIKDRLVRSGEWNQRTSYMGSELRERTFGSIGFGRIAQETVRLLSSFGMNPPIAFDPYANPAAATALGVELVDLDTLMSTADFVSVHCPLTEDTRGIIGEAEIAKMKPDSYLINTARGGIIDEESLKVALEERRIAGAAIDCFVDEPILTPHPFGELDNVILAPHAIAWTEELFRDIGHTACRALVNLARGEAPAGVVNPEVFDKPEFQNKWARLRLS